MYSKILNNLQHNLKLANRTVILIISFSLHNSYINIPKTLYDLKIEIAIL